MSTPRWLSIDLDNVTLSALQWGGDSGPLALCLHGFPDTAWTWRYLGPVLAERGWRVVAPFTRGYAPSEIPTDGSYHVGALMADALGVHEALGGDDSAVLIGHDWGAVTSNALAAYRGSPFRRIVSMAVPPVPSVTRTNPLQLVRQLRKSWYIGFNQLPRLPESSLDRLVPRLWRDWSPGYDASADLPAVATAIYARSNRAAALGYYRALSPLSRPPRHYRALQAAWLQEPRTPMLYLHGVNDGCMSVQLTDRVENYLPAGSAVLRVPGAGHFLQLEQPEQVNAAIIDFLS
ncbi:alpha/beta hydrolase [Skermania sp. ID1734]|uniref:alpha/beta fold hydrolase n=1 Tax=Skermania sp. ID1734 TaxID=2597516 RepID=UPI00117C4495|nr:alpha/beta hydrolase [Skermania sp. ID1734]TSE01234.1 alpha/beta hydrolase [Skermania sp. ID1734]